ncbi:hypothetical protein TSOC111612_17760 [Tsukamurella ocularis]
MIRPRFALRCAGAIAAVTLASGCATTVPGMGTAATSVNRSSAVPLPPGVDTGDYSPDLYAPKQGDADSAWVTEGNRMIAAIVLPSDVDPTLTRPVTGIDAVPTLASFESQSLPEGLNLLSGSKVGVALARADRADGATKEVRIGLYRYATDSDAGTQMFSTRSMLSDRPAVVLPSTPDGVAAEFESGAVDLFRQVGVLLLHVRAKGPSLPESIALADRIVVEQLRELQDFRPTPETDVGNLPLDREGVLARAVGVSAESDTDRRFIGLLTPPMYERRLADHSLVPLLREAGVDLMGWNYGKVMRARDAAAAKRLFDQVVQKRKAQPMTDPAGLSGKVVCFKDDRAKQVDCQMAVGRYYAQATSPDLTEAQQLASAQWVVLTRNP